MQDNESIDLDKEIKGLQEAVDSLDKRLIAIEQRLLRETSPAHTEPRKPVSLPDSLLADEIATNNLALSSLEQSNPSEPVKVSEAHTSETEPAVSSVEGQQVVDQQNLETEIGQYWLNKLGVTTLVVGIIFLVLYSFQYCNAPVKLLIGAAAAAALILFGEKIAQDEERKWYGHGLMGGGWALGYFIVYAMYYIDDLKLIFYYPIELALSLALSAAAMIRAVKCRSEVIAVLSATLAVYSICVSGPSLESNLPVVLIAALVSIVSIRQKWYGLFVWITLVSFIGHFSASKHVYSVFQAYKSYGEPITLAYLLTLWSIFNTAAFFTEETEEWQRQSIIAAACINAVSLLLGIILLTGHYLTEQRYLLIGAAGLFYLVSTPWLQRRKLKELTTVTLLIGLSFINVALWMKYTGTSMVLFDLFELALLAVIGKQYDIKSFRWFAIPLAVCFLPNWFAENTSTSLSESLGLTSLNFFLIGLLATVIFGTISWLYAKEKIKSDPYTAHFPYRDFYFAFASLTAMCAPYAIKDSMLALPCWSIQAVISAYLSIAYGEGFFWFATVVVALFAACNLLWTTSTWLWMPTLLIVAACYGLFAYCQQTKLNPAPNKTKLVSAVAGNIILTALFYAKLSTFWLSTGLALEALSLLTAGLFLRERVFRICGLLVLALLSEKLLFVDLAQAGTLQRIISFIASGLVFLAASYGYSRFTEKFGIKK
jgi:uncharacterized membrane protein